MRSRKQRTVIAGFAFATMLLGFALTKPEAARADCGMHEFEKHVPSLRKADDAKGQPRYVVHYHHDNVGVPVLVDFNVHYITNCDDEPPMTNKVANSLQHLWLGAIHAAAFADGYNVVANGETNADQRCYPLLKANARVRIAHELGAHALGGFNLNPASDPQVVALSRALKASPYYAHILALWISAMGQLDMPFPGFDHASFGYEEKYIKPAKIIYEHLPDGLHCNEIANWYLLTVSPVVTPAVPQ